MPDQPAPTLIVESEPDLANIRQLEECLYAFNVAATGIGNGKLFSVFLRGPDGTVIGGIHGWTWAGTCYVRLLYVPPDQRGQGHGSRLMAAIEQEAQARGCHEIVLHTHDFQAPGFYQKLGFEVVGRPAEFPRGYQFFTMVKALAQPGG